MFSKFSRSENRLDRSSSFLSKQRIGNRCFSSKISESIRRKKGKNFLTIFTLIIIIVMWTISKGQEIEAKQNSFDLHAWPKNLQMFETLKWWCVCNAPKFLSNVLKRFLKNINFHKIYIFHNYSVIEASSSTSIILSYISMLTEERTNRNLLTWTWRASVLHKWRPAGPKRVIWRWFDKKQYLFVVKCVKVLQSVITELHL